MERILLPNGMDFYCLNRNEALLLYSDLFEERSYFQHGVAIRPGDTVVDVGANIGLFALLASLEAPDVRVLSLEPLPPIYSVLRANFELHGIAGEALPLGIGPREQQVTFTFYPQNSALSGQYAQPEQEKELIVRLLRNRFPAMTPAGLEVLATRGLGGEAHEGRIRPLSAVLHDTGVTRVDLLKVDVEKAELGVLESIDEADWKGIAQVVVEVHDISSRLRRVREMLESRGFEVHSRQGPNFANTDLWDVFAIRTRDFR
ncbi:MAG: methyltransferase [Acidobacteriota bacterium]